MPQTATIEPGRKNAATYARSIPDAVIESVKKNISLFSLLSGYGITPVERGNTWFITCPFHDIQGLPEKTPSCSVSREKNEYHCFSCNESGDNVRFVMQYEKITFPAAVKKLLAIKPTSPIAPEKQQPAAKEKSEETSQLSADERQAILAEVVRRSVDDLRNSEGGRRYLESRGLDSLQLLESYTFGFWNGKTIDKLANSEKEKLSGVGLVNGNRALFENCIVFPLIKEDRISTLYGRKTIASSTPEGRHYLLPHRREGLYLPKQGLNPHHPVIVTESIIDALSLFTAGVKNVLPLLGVNGFLPDHEAYLREQVFPAVYIALNGDEAGNKAAAQLKENLKASLIGDIRIIELPAGKDINDMLREMGAVKLREWFEERMHDTTTKQHNEKPTVSEDEHGGLYVLFGDREYRIQGLTLVGMERLRANIKLYRVSDKNTFYVDTLDLYQAKAREHFITQAALSLKIEAQTISRDVNTLITVLEEIRLQKKDSGERTRYEMSDNERQEALDYLKAPRLLERIAADFAACGMVGNRNECLLAYLGALSRLTEKPFGTLIVSRSGAGKSYLQEMVASFTPKESLLPMTRLTGQSLFYQGKDGLKHKLLTIEEDEGMQEAMYSVRTLLSSQRLIIHGLKTDAKNGEFRAYQNTVEGPASVMISTTDLSAFDHESVSRFFVLHLDESREQTRAILDHQRKTAGTEKLRLAATRKHIERLHQNIQRLLKPMAVINRLGTGVEYPVEILNTRREQNKTEALIEAVALLNQYQREVKQSEFFGVSVRHIEVTKEDVEAVHAIAGEVLRQSLDELSKLCRELLCHIHELVHEKYREAVQVRSDIQRWQVSFTRKEIKDRTVWSNWHVIEHLRELEEQGYIASRIGKQGQRYAYALVEDRIPALPALKRTQG